MDERFERDMNELRHKGPFYHTYACEVAGHHIQIEVPDELSSHGGLKFEDHAVSEDPAKAVDPNYVFRRGRSFR